LTLEFILAVLIQGNDLLLNKKIWRERMEKPSVFNSNNVGQFAFPKIDFNSSAVKKLISCVTKIVRKEITNSREKNISRLSDIYMKELLLIFLN